MKAYLAPALVILVMAVVSNAVPLPYRPPVYGLGFLLWGLTLYPVARQQRPVPLARYLSDGDQLSFGKYVMMWIGMAILFMSISGMLLFR